MLAVKFIKLWFVLVGISIMMVALLNYIIDPFGVFHTGYFPYSREINERVAKIDYLNAHKEKYNAFLLGSSTIGTTNPKDIQQYIKGSRFYNLTQSSGNMYDFKHMLTYLIEAGFDVKHLYLQIDFTAMYAYGKHSSYMKQHHPKVLKLSPLIFYLRYLTTFDFRILKDKVYRSIYGPKYSYFDVQDTGMWFLPEADKKRKTDMKSYLQKQKSFHQKFRRTRGLDKNFEKSLKDFQDIVKLCEREQIDLVVLIAAYNHVRMDSYKIEDSLRFLKALTEIHDIWYFGGYNSVTNNDENYYEINHYISKVGALKAARIYHDSKLAVPKDFGQLLSKENVDTILSKERRIMRHHDSQFSR